MDFTCPTKILPAPPARGLGNFITSLSYTLPASDQTWVILKHLGSQNMHNCFPNITTEIQHGKEDYLEINYSNLLL